MPCRGCRQAARARPTGSRCRLPRTRGSSRDRSCRSPTSPRRPFSSRRPPRLASRLARRRRHVRFPQLAARFGIVGSDESAVRAVAAGQCRRRACRRRPAAALSCTRRSRCRRSPSARLPSGLRVERHEAASPSGTNTLSPNSATPRLTGLPRTLVGTGSDTATARCPTSRRARAPG